MDKNKGTIGYFLDFVPDSISMLSSLSYYLSSLGLSLPYFAKECLIRVNTILVGITRYEICSGRIEIGPKLKVLLIL